MTKILGLAGFLSFYRFARDQRPEFWSFAHADEQFASEWALALSSEALLRMKYRLWTFSYAPFFAFESGLRKLELVGVLAFPRSFNL